MCLKNIDTLRLLQRTCNISSKSRAAIWLISLALREKRRVVDFPKIDISRYLQDINSHTAMNRIESLTVCPVHEHDPRV